MKNSDLKAVYEGIFKKGYEKVYTSFLLQGKPTEEIEEILASTTWKGKRVVDIGCGTGMFSYLAAVKGADVLGIDYSREAIKIAQGKYAHPRLRYKVADAKNIQGKFDIVVSIGTLEHMDNPFVILKRMRKMLAPGGKIILTCPNWTNPRGYMLQTLHQLFGAKITLADLYYLTPVEFEQWARKLRMKLRWKTFDSNWAQGEKLIKDFKRRLPLVLMNNHLPYSKKRVDSFIQWIKDHVVPVEKHTPHSGALALYILS